jgi:hypothetical protein
VFDAMLDGWAVQQRARFLKARSVNARLGLVRRFTMYQQSVTPSSPQRRSAGKQMTEILKGTLEGLVLAILFVRPAYGYEITARLREQGFSDIAEGTSQQA